MRKIASQQVLCADKIDDINYKVVKAVGVVRARR
jgi:hypothetical protein